MELYTADTTDELGKPLNVISEKCSDRWEVAVTTSDTGFNQISFVNSIATTKVHCSVFSPLADLFIRTLKP